MYSILKKGMGKAILYNYTSKALSFMLGYLRKADKNKNTFKIIGHSHIDIVWKWRWMEAIEVVHDTFKTAIKLLNKYPDFRFMQTSSLMYEWMELHCPLIFNQVQKLVKEGRWEIIGGTLVESDMNIPSGESLARQFLYGKRYFLDKFGVDVKIAYFPDSFGYAGTVPQILKKSGIEYFVSSKMRWNITNAPKQNLFYWQSNDGSKILSFLTPGHYNNRLTYINLSRLRNFLFSNHKNAPFIPIIMGVGDHGGAVPEADIKKVHHIQEKFKDHHFLEFQRFDKTLDELKKSDIKIETLKDELYLENHQGCFTTRSVLKKGNRRAEILLESCEKMFLLTGYEYPDKYLHTSWKHLLINQFHDILPGSNIESTVEDSMEDYRYIFKYGREHIDKCIDTFSKEIDLSLFKKDTDKKQTIPILLYNSLSWAKDTLLSHKLPNQLNSKNVEVYNFNNEKIEAVKDSKNNILFKASIPACGYSTYLIKECENSSEAKRKSMVLEKDDEIYLENDQVRVVLSKASGNIESIFSKDLGKDIIYKGMHANQLEIFTDYSPIFPAWNIKYWGQGTILNNQNQDIESIEVIEDNDLLATIEVKRKYKKKNNFSQKISIKKDEPLIYFKIDFDFYSRNKLIKIAFPLNISNKSKRAFYDAPYGFIERRHDGSKDDFEVPAHKWVALQNNNDEFGIALYNNSKYGFDIKPSAEDENLNNIRMTLLKNSTSPRPGRYGLTFWGPYTDKGYFSAEYALHPFKKTWSQASIPKKAFEFNFPVYKKEIDLSMGKLAPTQEMVRIKQFGASNGVILSAIKKPWEKDSDWDVLIRLYESENQDAKIALSFPMKKIAKIIETDLIERPVSKEISVENEIVNIEFGKNEIKSFLLKFV
ncbi:MAG: glycoside hydrolase family 38 C-terminal domain-containing protein [Pseudomonadota bacterium]